MIARPRIRPLGLGELLDESFRIYRSYFLIFVAVAALVLVPYTLLSLLPTLLFQGQIETLQQQAAAGLNPLDGQTLWQFFGGLLVGVLASVGVSMLYTIFLQPLLEGALAHGVSQAYLERPLGVGSSYGAALRHGLGLIGARLIPALLGVLATGLILGFSLGSIALLTGFNPASDQPDTSRIGAGIALIFCMLGLVLALSIIGLLIFVRLIFTPQAVVIEGQGAWSGITRSWALTRGYFWRTLGYVLVIGLLVALLTAIPGLVVSVPLQLLLPDQLRLQAVINSVTGAIFGVLVTPFSLIAYTLMYYDLRIRKEGFDLEQTSLLGMAEPGAPSWSH